MTSTPALPFSERILEPVSQSLPQALVELSPDAADAPSVEPLDPSGSEDGRIFQIDGPEEVSFQIELELFSVREDACDLYVEAENGNSRHFRCEIEEEIPDQAALHRVTRAIAFFLLGETEQRRLQRSLPQPSLSEVSSHVPLLILDENGTIRDLTRKARHVLKQSPDDSIERNFFSHVHGHNLQRVMRDLAHMVTHGKQRAQWLLRIRTREQRWRWCRAHAENHLDDPEESIRVLLRPL